MQVSDTHQQGRSDRPGARLRWCHAAFAIGHLPAAPSRAADRSPVRRCALARRSAVSLNASSSARRLAPGSAASPGRLEGPEFSARPVASKAWMTRSTLITNTRSPATKRRSHHPRWQARARTPRGRRYPKVTTSSLPTRDHRWPSGRRCRPRRSICAPALGAPELPRPLLRRSSASTVHTVGSRDVRTRRPRAWRYRRISDETQAAVELGAPDDTLRP